MRNYPKIMTDLSKSIENKEYEKALSLSNEAVTFALYKMMEPITSLYVQKPLSAKFAIYRVLRH